MATDVEKLILSISADTTALKRQMDRATQDTKASADRIKKAVEGVGNIDMGRNMSKSMQQMQADAKNLTFQLNDITQGLLGGQSPFQVMMQQGSQVSQILAGGGGVGATLKTLGSALAGMVNPAGLAANALIFAAGMAVQYFTATEDGGEEAAKALKKHADELNALAQQWKDVLPGIEAYVEGLTKVNTATDKFLAYQKLLKETLGGVAEQAKLTEQDILDLEGKLVDLGQQDAARTLRKSWEEYNTEIQNGRQGQTQLKALQDAVTAAAATGVSGTEDLIAKMKALGIQVDAVNSKVGELGKMFGGMPSFLGGIGPPPEGFAAGVASEQGAAESRAFLKTRATNAKVAARIDELDDRFAVALAKLFEHLPSTATINQAARTFSEQAELYRKFKTGQGGLAAPPGRSHHEQRGLLEPAAADITGVDSKTLAEAVAKVKELEQLKGHAYEIDKVHVQLAGQNAKSQRDAAQASIDATDAEVKASEKRAEKAREGQQAYQDELKAQQDKIDLQLQENQINSDSSKTLDQKKIATDALRIARELDAAATKNGITLTEQVIDQHKRLAQSMALAQYSGEVIEANNKKLAESNKNAAKSAEDFAKAMGQTMQTAISGFINDLRNGVDAGEAFANMLDRIVDGLINMALNSLFDPKGGFGSLIGSIAGVGTGHKGGIVGRDLVNEGRHLPAALWASAPRMHSGGVVGLRPGEVPIIAQRGELIIPKSQVLAGRGAAGNVDQSVHQDNRISIDMSGTGMVAANSKDAKQVGENIQLLIQAELVRQSRPGGLLRKVPG